MLDLLGRTWAPLPLAEPEPPPAPLPPGAIVTVDEAWELFGIARKRATRAEVKKRYLAFVALNHPDKPDAPADAADLLVKANAAFALLERYCKW